MDSDIKIFYSGNAYIEGRTSRWDDDNYNVTIETWLKKSDLQTLRNNIRPGAVGELYNILGKPRFYDKSWKGKNTLKLRPNYSSNTNSNSNLMYMRNESIIYVKNISDSPVKGPSLWINCKIEGNISGSSL